MVSPIKISKNDSSLLVYAPAKVNLFLEVIGKRSDGYHNIETIMLAVNLYDKLEFRQSTSIKISSPGLEFPTNETNTIYKAANQLWKWVGKFYGFEVQLTKKIPIGAGLGGGSSDAAATILSLNKIYNLNLSEKDLLKIAEQVGSDVPFFLKTKFALCQGRGNIIKPLVIPRKIYLVLVFPNINISTKTVYEAIKIKKLNKLLTSQNKIGKMLASLEKGDFFEMTRQMFNRLEAFTFDLYPAVKELKYQMVKLSFGATIMSGSGSSIFGICKTRKEAKEKARLLKKLKLGKVFNLASI